MCRTCTWRGADEEESPPARASLRRETMLFVKES
jgi:hypothetical protein